MINIYDFSILFKFLLEHSRVSERNLVLDVASSKLEGSLGLLISRIIKEKTALLPEPIGISIAVRVRFHEFQKRQPEVDR